MSVRLLQLLFILLLGARSISLGQTNNQNKQVDTTAYFVVQVPPKFPGGPDAMFQFIQSTSRYPVNSKKGSLTIVKILVEKDGSISNMQVNYTEADDDLVSEAKRIVKLMPKWIPGSQDGQILRAYTAFPIRFVKAK
jgi:protein TonB